MANTRSAKKAVRRCAQRTVVNANRRSRIRGFVRKVEESIAGGDAVAAAERLKIAEGELMRGVRKGVWPQNTASRKVSRLALRINKLA